MKNLWFRNVLESIAEQGRDLLGLDHADRSDQGIQYLCSELLAGHGEASGIALSQEILRMYSVMNTRQKHDFFCMLAQEFELDVDLLQEKLIRYRNSHAVEDLIAMNAVAESPRQELFRRLNMAPFGTAKLVSLRADLLGMLQDNPPLKAVDADLKHLFSSWFNRGFLQLRKIDWNSPACILEKLINYESVHEIQGWDDLRRRLMKDRRCFAFFHPGMPDEPIIFIQVAFVQGLSSQVDPLIDPQAPVLDPSLADTAIFFSINNTQSGLRGISFGNFLIKQVLTELIDEFPEVQLLSTLSPVPALATALQYWFDGDEQASQQYEFDSVLQRYHVTLQQLGELYGVDNTLSNRAILQRLLRNHVHEEHPHIGDILRDLALVFLTSPDDNGQLADPVAFFHLSNGARLERINAFANMSQHGISISYGVMVNYLYDLKHVESNHEAFVTQGEVRLSAELGKKLGRFKKAVS